MYVLIPQLELAIAVLLHDKDWQNVSINLGPVKVRHHNVVSWLDNLHLFLQFIPIFRMLALIVASLDLFVAAISSHIVCTGHKLLCAWRTPRKSFWYHLILSNRSSANLNCLLYGEQQISSSGPTSTRWLVLCTSNSSNAWHSSSQMLQEKVMFSLVPMAWKNHYPN